MELKQKIEQAFHERAKQIGLSYDAVHVEKDGDLHVISTSKDIGGVMCRGGVNIGKVVDAENYLLLVNIAATRQQEWWDRIEQEYKDDVGLADGIPPKIRAEIRTVPQGHFTSGKWAKRDVK